MKKQIAIRAALIILVFLGSITLYGQNISITFTGTVAATQVDSVTATNLTTNQRITLPGNESLMLTAHTGIPTVSEEPTSGIVYPNPFSGSTIVSISVQNPQYVYFKGDKPVWPGGGPNQGICSGWGK